MTFQFDPNAGVVVVRGELWGPTGSVELRLLLDTGADVSVIAPGSMASVGYDPLNPPGHVSITTASSAGYSVGFYRVNRLTALGLNRVDFPVLCYALPPEVDFEGLLGIDFFAGHVLTLDFVNYTVSLT